MEVADPVAVRDAADETVLWLVPLLRGDRAAGFVTLTTAGRVQRVGTFGSGPRDSASWIPAAWFAAPQADMLAEVRARYPGSNLSEPVFSFDRVPDRWGWRVRVGPPAGQTVFIGPRGWYAVPAEKD